MDYEKKFIDFGKIIMNLKKFMDFEKKFADSKKSHEYEEKFTCFESILSTKR